MISDNQKYQSDRNYNKRKTRNIAIKWTAIIVLTFLILILILATGH